MKREFITNNFSQTKTSGKILAQEVLKTKSKKAALLLCLEGELGGGKTTFLQAFGKGLGIEDRILSPTFVILKRFQIPDSRFQNFYHIDCYRIEDPKEILDLGFREIIKNPENIVAIEWAEKIKKIIPPRAIWIKFEFIDKNKRKITIRD
jgi:tRNA threonylcarbamoyladenosine biosynthesis protein TsaE